MDKQLKCETCGKLTVHNLTLTQKFLTARLEMIIKIYQCAKCKTLKIIRKEKHYEKKILDG